MSYCDKMPSLSENDNKKAGKHCWRRRGGGPKKRPREREEVRGHPESVNVGGLYGTSPEEELN